MARSAYKSAKRSKELRRLKKQEEKRLRRQGKDQPPAAEEAPEGSVPEESTPLPDDSGESQPD